MRAAVIQIMEKQHAGKEGSIPSHRIELPADLREEAHARIEGAILEPLDVPQLRQQKSYRLRDQLIMVKPEELFGGFIAVTDSAILVEHQGGQFVVSAGGCGGLRIF